MSEVYLFSKLILMGEEYKLPKIKREGRRIRYSFQATFFERIGSSVLELSMVEHSINDENTFLNPVMLDVVGILGGTILDFEPSRPRELSIQGRVQLTLGSEEECTTLYNRINSIIEIAKAKAAAAAATAVEQRDSAGSSGGSTTSGTSEDEVDMEL